LIIELSINTFPRGLEDNLRIFSRRTPLLEPFQKDIAVPDHDNGPQEEEEPEGEKGYWDRYYHIGKFGLGGGKALLRGVDLLDDGGKPPEDER
jgi:hypothetical protein